MVMPRMKLRVTPTRPTVSEMRAPLRMRESMSRPSRSVPKRNRLPPSGGQTRCRSPETSPQNS